MKPSNSEHEHAPTEYALRVESDSLAEIFVIDGRLNLIDRGVGTLNRRLPAGLYKVKVRAGNTAKEKMVILDRDQTMRLAPPPLASAAPLDGTALTHEYHITEAIRMSAQVDLDRGRGATIFIFARCWTAPSIYKDIEPRDLNPAKGISLLTLDGKLIAEVEKEVNLRSAKDPYAGLTVSVDPGPYLLRQSIDRSRSLDQMIYASPGWQTQVFLVRANPDADSSQTPLPNDNPQTSLTNSNRITSLSILIGRSNFHAYRADLRLAEVARATLARERPIQLDPQITRDAIDEKFENPVLGLFAAHLMLLAKESGEKQQRTTPSSRLRKRSKRPIEDFDQNLFDLVVQNLTKFLGADHPDVQALSLKCLQRGPEYVGTFSVPPMLRRSWSLIVDANEDIPSLLPLDLWKTVAQMTASRPFLSWVTFQGNDEELRQKLADAVNQPSFEEMVSSQPAGPARALLFDQPAAEVPQEQTLRRKLAREMGIPKVALDWASERK